MTARPRQHPRLPKNGSVPSLPAVSAASFPAGSDSPAPRTLSPLSRVRAGCVVIVRQLTASDDTNQRLREMGFGEEQRVKVITLQNNVLCQVCNARLGLSARLAEQILVETLPAPSSLPFLRPGA